MSIEPKKTLILRILNILENYSSEDNPLKQQDIIDLLRKNYEIICERKAVSRNISILKEIGYEIESTPKGSYLANREFDHTELRVLIDGVISSRYINAKHSKDLIDKLIKLGGINFKTNLKHIYSLNNIFKTENKDFFLNIEILGEAIEEGKQVSFDYLRYGLDKKLDRKKDKENIVNPYQMIIRNQKYYLIANMDNSDLRFYRIEKIKNIRKLDNNNYIKIKELDGYKNGIDLIKFANTLPYMFANDIVKITLKCPNWMADELVDWFGDNFTVKKIYEDYFESTITTSHKAMSFWIMQYAENVEVLTPISLREEIRRKLGIMNQVYKD